MASLNFDSSPLQNDATSAKSALVIFGRAPRLGEVKTRLARERGAPFALQLYRAMLRDCFDLGRQLAPAVAPWLCFTPADGLDDLRDLWDGSALPQNGEDLGARMLNAMQAMRARGCARCVLIGSDAPDLPLEILRSAFDELNENQIVVAPSVDGGFVLIGASCDLPNEIFAGIVWSRDDVFARLIVNLELLKLTHFVLPQWHDVDEAADLETLKLRLQTDEKSAPATRELLETSAGAAR